MSNTVTQDDNGLVVAAYVLGGVGILVLPFLFGTAAIVCAQLALNRGNPKASNARTFAIIATCIGMVLYILAGTTMAFFGV